MGYAALKDVGHSLEDVFERLRKLPQAPEKSNMDLIDWGIRLMESMLLEIEQTGKLESSGEEFIAAAAPKIVVEDTASAKPDFELIVPPRQSVPHQDASESKFFFKIDLKIAHDASLPAARALVAVKRIEDLGKISRLTPTLQEIAGGQFTGHFTCYVVTSFPAPEIAEELSALSDVQKVSVTPVDPGTRQTPRSESSSLGAQVEERLRGSMRSKTVRVDTQSVDRVIESLGELLILNAHLQEDMPENPEIQRLQVLSQQIYEDVLDLRMLPFQTLSSHFPRVVQDLSHKLQKKMEFEVAGADLQMDKSILDELADPLLHLIRNAVDHGIEAPSIRAQLGKPESGRLRLSVSKQGDRVLIRMEDDGKGLDPDFIRKVAVRKGVISEKTAAILSQQEVLLLLARPGFSTTDRVSDISGRGVGLDVVRDKIESLGGAFRMFFVPGQFTRFDLIVPFTIAILPALLFRAGDLRLAAPMSRIDRFLKIYRKDVHYTMGRPVIFYDNSTYYLEKMHSVVQRSQPGEFDEEFCAFVTEHQNRRIAWVVEELISERQIVLKSLEAPLDQLSCFSGVSVIGKGEIIPVMDLEQLYRERYQ